MNIQNLIWGLEELSDRDLQEKLWTGKMDGEMSSFVEAICSTFNDSGLASILDSERSIDQISSEIKEKALQLNRSIKRVPQSATTSEIIEHPAMNDVRVLAAELLALVNK
jgi:hypothetical protein